VKPQPDKLPEKGGFFIPEQYLDCMRSICFPALLVIIISGFFFLSQRAVAQTPEPSLLLYTHGLRAKNNALLLNIRGYEVIVEQAKGNFSKPYVRTMFPGLDLHQSDKVFPDSIRGEKVLRIDKQATVGSLTTNASYYFVEKGKDSIQAISIVGTTPRDAPIRLEIVDQVRAGIPDSLISDQTQSKMLFAGRSIAIDRRCMWTGSSCVLCSGFGEMNWSMHPDRAEAQQHADWHVSAAIGPESQFELISQDTVQVIFEGSAAMARKLQLRLKGAKGKIAKTAEGSRTLIMYFVVTEVRGRYVSCALSHWTSDYLEEYGLPPLLGEVMRFNQ
jgi:hypothetical protein